MNRSLASLHILLFPLLLLVDVPSLLALAPRFTNRRPFLATTTALSVMSKETEVIADNMPTAAAAPIQQSSLSLLEHVNLNVPDQGAALDFYFRLLGCGMDPRKADNLQPDAKKKTLWANCGASQFHLPYGTTAQRIPPPGHIGLRYDSLEGLQERLQQAPPGTVRNVQTGTDRHGRATLRLVDRYENVFLCTTGGNPVRNPAWKQPIIGASETEQWGSVATDYGMDVSDCRGLAYVEFPCPVKSATKIAQFYRTLWNATASVVEDDDGTSVAMVAVGTIDPATGQADQSLLFRETTQPLPEYDGHHVALYVGETAKDFEEAFLRLEAAHLVWVNPRFSDDAMTLERARHWKQFRFKDIVDLETGDVILQLEHEMRSIEHEAWPGKATVDDR